MRFGWLFLLLQPTVVWAHSLYPTYIGLGVVAILLCLGLIWGIYRLIKYGRAKSKSNL